MHWGLIPHWVSVASKLGVDVATLYRGLWAETPGRPITDNPHPAVLGWLSENRFRKNSRRG